MNLLLPCITRPCVFIRERAWTCISLIKASAIVSVCDNLFTVSNFTITGRCFNLSFDVRAVPIWSIILEIEGEKIPSPSPTNLNGREMCFEILRARAITSHKFVTSCEEACVNDPTYFAHNLHLVDQNIPTQNAFFTIQIFHRTTFDTATDFISFVLMFQVIL